MFDLRFSNDPFALPTAMAAAMLAGIVGLGWRMNVAQRLTMPSMTVTAQAAPATAAMPTFRPEIARAFPRPMAARPVARQVTAHQAAARIAMQMRPVPAAPPALNATTVRPAMPTLATARRASLTASPRIAPAAARLAAAPASARGRLAMTTRPAPSLAPSRPAPSSRPVMAARGTPPAHWVTVQPGQTLWQIAQQTYGNGDQYMRIFRANRARLSRPDQIRPGQRLRVPTAPSRARVG